MYRTKAQRAEFNGSNPPYGYEVLNKKLKIRNDSTPDTVRRVFKEYIEGNGFDAIVRGLYNEEIASPSQLAGKSNASDKWHGSSIRNLLENPHYSGMLVQCREYKPNVTSKKRKTNELSEQVIIENSHEQIIPLKDFLLVQKIIQSRKRPQNEKHMFTNTAICSDCGRGMHFKKNRRGYICGNYNKHGIKACSDHLIKEVELSKYLLKDIQNLYKKLQKNNYYKRLSEKLSSNKLKIETKFQENITHLEKKKKDKSNLVISLSNSVITNEDYQLAVKITSELIAKIEISNSKLLKELEHEDTEKELNEFKKNSDKFIDYKILTSEMLHMLVDKIEVQADGTANVHYRFKEPTVPSN